MGKRLGYRIHVSKPDRNAMKEIVQKIRIPKLIILFSIFLIGSSTWWFIQIFINPKWFSNPSNIFYSFTKLGILVAGINLLKRKKWAIYLYGVIYIITAISFFAGPAFKNMAVPYANILDPAIFVVLTGLVSFMFFKYWEWFQ